MLLDLTFTRGRVMRIRVLLAESQAVFAKRLGVREDMVSRYETGKAVPMQAKVLKALLEAEQEAEGKI